MTPIPQLRCRCGSGVILTILASGAPLCRRCAIGLTRVALEVGQR